MIISLSNLYKLVIDILLLIVSSTLYFKNKEGLDTAGLTGDSLQKTVIINDINGKIISKTGSVMLLR